MNHLVEVRCMKAADITNLRFSSYEPVEDFMYSLSVYNKDKFDTGYIGNGAWRILSLKKENEDSNEIISYRLKFTAGDGIITTFISCEEFEKYIKRFDKIN